MNNEKRYGEVITIANEVLKKYPSNFKCYWEKAKAQISKGDYEKAEKNFKIILKRIQAEPFESNYNAVLCHYYLLESYFAQKKYVQCQKEFNAIKSLSLSSIEQKRLEKKLEKASTLQRKSRKGSASHK